MTDDILASLGAQRTTDAKRRHRHRWELFRAVEETPYGLIQSTGGLRCHVCGVLQDEAKSRRGKNARSRGNAYERDVARRLGGIRVGQYGGTSDVTTAPAPINA